MSQKKEQNLTFSAYLSAYLGEYTDGKLLS